MKFENIFDWVCCQVQVLPKIRLRIAQYANHFVGNEKLYSFLEFRFLMAGLHARCRALTNFEKRYASEFVSENTTSVKTPFTEIVLREMLSGKFVINEKVLEKISQKFYV